MKSPDRLCTALPALLALCSLTSRLVAQHQVPARPAGVRTLTMEATPLPEARPCPSVVRFQGVIETSSAGLVRYRLRSSDGQTTPSYSVRMKAEERRDIIHLHRFGEATDTSASGWVQLEVTTPTGQKTARARFKLRCARDPVRNHREAGLGSTVLQDMEVGARGEDGNLLERFGEAYLRRRGYSIDRPFADTRMRAYGRLREMRRAQQRPHVPAGWSTNPDSVAPGTLDPNNCAWSSNGPTNINGRVTHIAIDPTNNQRVFVTTVGGIWRSIDGARRWQRVSDDFLSTVFASVAINPATPSEVFAGGGDPNYHGGWRGGLGIWRSTSSGDPASWAKVSPPELDNHVIYRLRVDPAVPNNVYAATSNGVYLGTRSGATITFARLGGFDAWANDIVVDFSTTPRLVYAGVRSSSATFAVGIWKYDGTTWNQRNTGIPTANARTIVLALAHSNPSVLYAKVESNDGHSQGVYKTTTAAETPGGGGNAWTATGSALDDSCAGFCYSWYNSTLEVDPTDQNIVWGGGLSIYRTVNGGTTWDNLWLGSDAAYPLGVHADHHAIAFDPTNSKIVYVADDGGIFRTSDMNVPPWRWNNVAHGMLITEFYRATSQQALAPIAAGGTQDNGTIVTFGNRTWYEPGGCDGYDVAIDAANASTLYANCNGGLYELTNPVPWTVGGGTSATWTLPAGVTIKSPLMTDPGVAGAALAGGYTTAPGPTPGSTIQTWFLLKTTDGLNWNIASPNLTPPAMITAIGIAPSSAFQTYYLGIGLGSVGSSPVWRTTDGGTTWTQPSAGLPAGLWINSIAVDVADPARAIAATNSGIFLTVNTGANWDPIGGSGSSALPTTAITGAVFDPNNADGVFAVTDIGAFRGVITPASGSTPASASWTPFDEGLPDGLDINDIWVNQATGIIKIGTMGHGGYQRDVRPGITCPSASLLVRDNVNDRGVTPSPSGLPDPEHPIPDLARPGFYMPDNTVAGRLYWWESTDIRIDVPASAPVKNQIAAADHVEMETCPIQVADCPPGTILDAYPQRGRTARVYAQVNNAGLQAAANVRVVALFADASAGLPLLPNDFWTTTFPAGSTTCGPLNTSTGWHFTDATNPCKLIPVVNPELPEVVGFNWTVPMSQAGHSCMLIISESPTDPLNATIRATNLRDLGQLVPGNRQISLRNLHVVDAPPAPAGGRPRAFEVMNVFNPDREARYVELVISKVDFPRNVVVGIMLPRKTGVTATGTRLVNAPLTVEQRRSALTLKVDTAAFFRITSAREAVIRLPIPPGEVWRLGLLYDVGGLQPGTSARWSIVARQGKKILGGNTYIIRRR